MQRLLVHPNTIMLGPRYFEKEIAACSEVLRRTPSQGTRYMVARAARKLLRRFDDFLWEAKESKLRKVYPSIQEMETAVETIQPDRHNQQDVSKEKLEKILESLPSLARTITAEVNLENISIDQVRNISSWAHMSSSLGRKVVIIENSHKMLESARNSLLKILEEPPEGVYFVLTTERKSSLIATILSRLRHYYFTERDSETAQRILKMIFREETAEYDSLRDYFLAWTEQSKDHVRGAASRFLQSILGSEEINLFAEHEELVPILRERERAALFLEELLSCTQTMMRDETISQAERASLVSLIETWAELIRETSQRVEVYNQRPDLAVESLYYRMREAV